MANAYDINSWYRSQTVEYKPTRQADIVVVNLNTNDNAQVKNLIDDELATAKAEYKAAAKLMIEKIRAINGEDVKILWVCGMMSNGNDPINVQADAWIAELFEEMGGEAKGLYLLTGLIRNTSGAAGHPVELYHGLNAERIAQFIKENILK